MTEIGFSRYFHFNWFPPLSHTHEPLTHALLCQALIRSRLDAAKLRFGKWPSNDPSSTHSTEIAPIHSDPLTIQARRTRRTSLRSTRTQLRSAHEPSSDPLHTGNETSSDPLQANSDPHSDPLRSKLRFSRRSR